MVRPESTTGRQGFKVPRGLTPRFASTEAPAYTRVGGGMAGAAHDHELALLPRLSQLPCGDERSTEIKSTVDHHPGDTSKGTRFPH